MNSSPLLKRILTVAAICGMGLVLTDRLHQILPLASSTEIEVEEQLPFRDHSMGSSGAGPQAGAEILDREPPVLRSAHFSQDILHVIEWGSPKVQSGELAIEAIADLDGVGRIHLSAIQGPAGDWQIRDAAFLGEYVVLNEQLPHLNKEMPGQFVPLESNHLVTRVRFSAETISEADLIQQAVDSLIPDEAFSRNVLVYPAAVPNDSQYASSWTLAKLELEPVWEEFGFSPEAQLGRRAIIAVIDNGAPNPGDYHTWINEGEIAGNGIDDDGNNKIDDVYGWSFASNSPDVSFAGGHGSTVTKVAASLTNNGTGTASPASSAALMRVLYYEATAGSHFDAIDAMLYAIANGADAVNCSFISTSPRLFDVVLDYAQSENCVVVAAAGNYGKDLGSSPVYPGALVAPSLLTVGSSDTNDNRVSGSSYGAEEVDLFAPGGATSFTTPLVTSTVALLRALKPDATSVEIANAIRNGVDTFPQLQGICVSGGRLNVRGAVESLLGVSIGGGNNNPTPPTTPSLTMDEIGETTIELSWTTGETVDSFEVQISESGSGFAPLEPTAMFSASSSGVLVNGLLPSTEYAFRLRAIKGALASGWTTSPVVTTLAPALVAPNEPVLTIASVDVGSVDLSWSAEADVESFEMQVSEAGGTYGSTTIYAGTKSGVQLTSLGEGVSYQFRLRAVRGGLNSSWAVSEAVTTLSPAPVAPNKPVLTIASVDVGLVDLSWSAEANVDSFELQISEAGGTYGSTTIYAGTESGVQLSSLGEGVSYQFRLRAVRDGLTSSWAVSEAVTTLEPTLGAPGKPTFAVDDIGLGTVTLSWSGDVGVDNFQLQTSQEEGSFGSMKTYSGTSNGVQLTDLGEGVGYQFRLRAVRNGLFSGWTTSPSVTTLAPAPIVPEAPTIVVNSIGIGSVNLNWSAAADVESFEMQVSEAGGTYGSTTIYAGTKSGVQLTSLGEGVSYQFRLRAVRGGLTSSWAVSEAVTTLSPAPVAPNKPVLTIASVDVGAADLSWSAEANVDSFELQISEAGGTYGSTTIYAGTKSGVQLTSLGEGVSYQFRLRAVRGGLTSSWAVSEAVTTLEATLGAPSKPTFAVDDIGLGTVTLSWSGDVGVDNFQLQTSNEEGSFGSMKTYSGTSNGVQLTDLGEGVGYQFRLRAVRNGLFSGWTTSPSVTTLAPAPIVPEAPTIVVNSIGIGSVNLNWSAAADVERFEMQVSEAGAAYGPTTSYAGTKSGVQLTSLGEGVSYQFRLRAVRGGLNSTWAVSEAVTTLSPAPVAPNKPVLTIASVDVGAADLSWSAEADVESFELQVSEAGGTYGSTTSYVGTETGVQLSSLGEGVSYQFRLRAVRGGLTSSWAVSEAVTTLEPTLGAPGKPTFAVNDIGLGTVTLSWSGDVGVDNFQLQTSKEEGSFGSMKTYSGTSNGVQLTDLGEGVGYQFRLRAVRNGLFSGWTTSPSVTTLAPAPVAPEAPQIFAEAIDSSTVFLSWSSPEAVDSFEIECLENGQEPIALDPFEEEITEAEVSGLVSSATYTFRIRSLRNGLASKWVTSDSVVLPNLDASPGNILPSHYWNFDEASDGVANDDNASALDLDVSTLGNGAGIGTTNKGLTFSSEHAGVQIPDSEGLNLGTISTLTISFWFKMDASAESLTSVLYEQGGYWRGLNLIIEDGWLQANGWNRPSKESDWQGTTLHAGKIKTGVWTHIALVLNAGPTVVENGLTLYLNGSLVASGPASQLWQHTDNIGLGQVHQWTVYRGRQISKLDPLQGDLDDLSIWDIALTEAEIETLILSSYE